MCWKASWNPIPVKLLANWPRHSIAPIRQSKKALGKVANFGCWVPHELTVDNKKVRLTTCVSLLSRFNSNNFLNQIVTGDEKWVLYISCHRKHQWLGSGEHALPEAKDDLHPRKVMLCVWWDCRGIVYYELLEHNMTITSEIYSDQMTKLNEALIQQRPALINRKGVLLLHNNARPHTSKATRSKIEEFGWEILPHPKYLQL
jgi:histone-lysine N-methyltransferase SETMAR